MENRTAALEVGEFSRTFDPSPPRRDVVRLPADGDALRRHNRFGGETPEDVAHRSKRSFRRRSREVLRRASKAAIESWREVWF
jgi:hypothetical protein